MFGNGVTTGIMLIHRNHMYIHLAPNQAATGFCVAVATTPSRGTRGQLVAVAAIPAIISISTVSVVFKFNKET